MLSQFSKWLVFVSSFEVLFLLLMLKMLGVIPRKDETIFETWRAHFSENRYAIILLIGLTIISLFWMGYLTRWKNNTRFTAKLKGNHSFEMAIFFRCVCHLNVHYRY
jgi:hypothetical protein